MRLRREREKYYLVARSVDGGSLLRVISVEGLRYIPIDR